MGTNGFQEPATAVADNKIIGTKRLYTDGKFSTKDGKALFLIAPWRGLVAAGKADQKAKFQILVNNGLDEHGLAESRLWTNTTISSWTACLCPSSK
ncbi:MAG: hypothetical protein MZV49_07260 [Rhodopseudomonas palustris]|nr:hypothetical protein [Rhodopseudomonas palustris]